MQVMLDSAAPIVAAIDLKTDRQNKKLLMQKWSWVGKGAGRGAARKDYKRRIEEALAGSSGFSSQSRELAAGLHGEPFAGGMPALPQRGHLALQEVTTPGNRRRQQETPGRNP